MKKRILIVDERDVDMVLLEVFEQNFNGNHGNKLWHKVKSNFHGC